MSFKSFSYKFPSFLFLASLGLGQAAMAQDQQAKVVTTAVSYLRISADVRSSGMGDAGIASGADGYSAFRNLAKTPFNEKKAGIAATYNPWMGEVSDGIYLAALTGFYKLKNDQAISGSVRFFQMGTTELSDENGNVTGSVTPRDLAIDAGYSRKLGDHLSLGVALRFIHSKLTTGNFGGVEYKAGNAVAGDISLYYDAKNEAGAGFSAGLVASNLGTKINYTKDADADNFIPANLGIGVAYTTAWEGDNTFTLQLEGNKLMVPAAPLDATKMAEYRSKGVMQSWFNSFGSDNGGLDATQVSAGLEYGWQKTLYLRGGYVLDGQRRTLGSNRGFLTLGLGVHYKSLQFDFSYLAAQRTGVSANATANTLRFGLAAGF